MRAVLACDLGGSAMRVAIVDDAGTIRQSHTITMSVAADAAGVSEVDPERWWQALGTSVAELAHDDPTILARVEAIAIAAMTRTQVLVGRTEQALRPAILWNDSRAEPVMRALLEISPVDHPETTALNADHPLTRLWWLKHAEPDIFLAAAHILEPKDYLNLRLTGSFASDTVSMARLVSAAKPGASGPSLFDAADVPASLLPPMLEPLSVMGYVRTGLSGAIGQLAGLPVITMANDTWAAVTGLGAMRAGAGYNLSGTSEVLGLVSTHAATAQGLLTVDWSAGHSQLGGPSLTGGDTLAWLLAVLAGYTTKPMSTGSALDQLLSGTRDPDPLLFLPYLQGERVPYWDPSLRGAWVGLNRRHGSSDLAWSVLEGIAFLNRIVLERAERATGSKADEIRFGGGGATNPVWCQIKADILDRPVTVTASEQPGLLGAAIAAWTTLGRFPDLAAAQSVLVHVKQRFLPAPERRAHYDRLFEVFCQADTALAPIGRRLAGWQSTA